MQESHLLLNQSSNISSISILFLLWCFKEMGNKNKSLKVPKPLQKHMCNLFFREINSFLKLVSEGNLEGAEKLLQKDPSLALMSADITDLCGREFKNITGLQYATWCLDAEMAEMIYKTLSPSQAALQWDALENDKYIEKNHGKQFSFDGLLKAYDAFNNNPTKQTLFAIGKEQQKVPAWYIYAFCEEGSNVAWAKQDFKLNIKREVAKNHTVKWTTEIYNGGLCGVSFTWVRGLVSDVMRPSNQGPDVQHYTFFYAGFDSRGSQQLSVKQQEQLSQLQAKCKNVLVINEKLIGSGGLKKN